MDNVTLIRTFAGFLVLIPLMAIGLCLYFTPWFIARGTAWGRTIFWWNLLTAWTGIGWAAILAWAIWARTGPEQARRNAEAYFEAQRIGYQAARQDPHPRPDTAPGMEMRDGRWIQK